MTATPVSANAARGAMQEERNGIHWGHDMPLDFDASLVGRSIEIMWPMGSQTQRLATIEG